MRRLFLLLVCLCARANADVPQGTAIQVMLLKDIGSSTSRVGEVVPMVVTHDVESGGRVVIPEGTMVFAKISQCRREGALSAPVFDKPARLSLKLEHLRDIDGKEVQLVPKPNSPGDLPISRDMTVKANAAQSRGFEMAMDNPSSRSVMHKVHTLFVDTAVSLSVREAEVLAEHNVAIPKVQQAIRNGVFDRVLAFIRDLKRGHPVDALIDITPMTRTARIAVEALQELGRLSGGVAGYIEGRFKGRNIRCPAGVELTVYTG